MNKLVTIGYIKKPHGIKGELKVQIEEAYLEDFTRVDVVFLAKSGAFLPYFIQDKTFGNHLVVSLDEVKSRNEAEALSGAKVAIRESDVIPDEDRTLIPEEGFEFLDGYLVIDSEQGEIGPILEILELPQQQLALVDYKGKEVMLPLHEDLILGIDEDKKQVKVDIPEGLLEL